MSTVVSADGTTIAYETRGDGPPLILIDGAMCHRGMGPAENFAAHLSAHFTVYLYDRRGRGESGNTQPYAVDREIEDLAALLGAAGGSAYVFGQSSGAVLAADAANRLTGITRLALYEPPFIVDGTHAPRPATYLPDMEALIAADRRSDAVKMFLRSVGVPAVVVAIMKLTPPWKKMTAVAPTLPYDMRVLGDTGRGVPLDADRWKGVTAPALVMDGGKSPQYMRNGAKALAGALHAEYRTVAGQNHMVKAQAVTPALVEFFTADHHSRPNLA